MKFKLSSVLDDQRESDANGFPSTATGKPDGQNLPAAVPLLEATNLMPLSGGGISLQLKSTEWLASDNYQVALVPIGHKAEQERRNSQAHLKMPVLVLPLPWKELVVRLCTGVHPWTSGRENSGVRFGEVFADFLAMEVSRSGENVALTTMEFKLLRFLVQNAGRVLSRDELLNEVWGYENYPCTRTVDNHILKLRQKLELDPVRPVHFHTVHGVGYKFVLEASRVVADKKM